MEAQKITLTVDELSERMGIGLNRAYDLVRSKGFPSIRFGRKFLIPVRDLEAWLSEQASKGCKV